MALSCPHCGKPIPERAAFCASCGTAVSTASLALAATAPLPAKSAKITASPRSGGAKGLLIAFGSLGCLAVIVFCVLVLGIGLHLVGQKSGSSSEGGPQPQGPVYNQSLDKLLPGDSGGFALKKVQTLDSETVTMFGAADALRGRYSSGMALLVLNYTSAERASRGIGPLRNLLYPEKEGWSVIEQGAAATGYRVAILQSNTGTMATMWTYGSLILIFSGDTAQVPAFEKPAPELLSGGAKSN